MKLFLEQHYLSILIFMPLVFTMVLPFLKEGENGRNIHRFAILATGILYGFSTLAWNGWLTPHPVLFAWIPSLSINYALDTDGLSTTLVFLTTFLMLMASVASLTNIAKRVKLYYAMIFILTTSILGVFLARDLFLFFLFWELELIPMYFLIAIWGGPRREFAAMKFVLYTLFGSVFLVAGILALYFTTKASGLVPHGYFLFSSVETVLASSRSLLPMGSQILIFIAFFITFAVKLPMVPFHTWLPDAHVEAPTPISMLLAGILLKMGSYGLLRFCFGFFPHAAEVLVPYIALAATINIVYTAGVALVQEDMKKLIAYSSVSHMGFVLLGLSALNAAGFNGAVFVMFAHGLVSAALFMCVGTLYRRTHSRLISDYGGFGSQTPVLFYFFLFMGMASLGLPLLVSFASETLVFYGAYISRAFTQVQLAWNLILPWSIQTLTVISALGVVIGAAYTLWLLKRLFYGPLQERWKSLPDASPSEVFVLATLAILVLLFGFFPQSLISQFEPTVTRMSRAYVQPMFRVLAEGHDEGSLKQAHDVWASKLPVHHSGDHH
ncbi:MAG: NuoM family protein [Candidatus Melainabacteria bacterium]